MDFCHEFTFHDHYKIDRVVKLNHVCDFLIDMLFKCDFISEDKNSTVLGVIDDLLLMVIHGNVENLVHEINNSRKGSRKLLCPETL